MRYSQKTCLEVVHNDGVIAFEVVGPGLSCQLLVRAPRPLVFRDVGFLQDAVQVLMQAVQQKGQQLLAVLLGIALRKAQRVIFG